MLQKAAIKYLRFSSEGQSTSSIEWQNVNTDSWCRNNNVLVKDVFIDEGYSARTFDRPDFEKLYKFIEKNYKTVDYLIVSQLNRFSRDAGEAITMVKRLQMQYNIQIVSVTEGITYDYFTPGSHFRSGLQLLLAEDDNITRMTAINSGIYTAKATEGRYIGAQAPFGYIISGSRKTRSLVIDDEKGALVKDIFSMFASGISVFDITRYLKSKGQKIQGNSVVQKILQNPVYTGRQYVKPFKQEPGGLFKARHEAIIDIITWQQVQSRFKSPRVNYLIKEDMPMRGVLHCHCGRLLTGAPSKGKMGKYYNYYKCNAGPHNNISASFAHAQFDEVLANLTIPNKIIDSVRSESFSQMKIALRNNAEKFSKAKRELADVEQKLLSLEEKWINNQIHFDTYSRWFNDFQQKKTFLHSSIDNLSNNESDAYKMLNENIDDLADLRTAYHFAPVIDKQEIVKLVFDNKLYYENKVYRTPYLMDIFLDNVLKLKEKGLLFVDEKRGFQSKFPSGGAAGNPIEPLMKLLKIIKAIRA